MAKQLEAVYGEALLEYGREQGKRKEWRKEAELLLEIWKDNPELSLFLNHPGISREEKLQTMDAIFRRKCRRGSKRQEISGGETRETGWLSDELMGFLKVIVEKGRQNRLETILSYFIEAVKEDCHIGRGCVTAPMELTPRQKKAVEQRILETTHYEAVELCWRTDPSLIGGLVIQICGREADSSVKRKLERMKQEYGE